MSFDDEILLIHASCDVQHPELSLRVQKVLRSRDPAEKAILAAQLRRLRAAERPLSDALASDFPEDADRHAGVRCSQGLNTLDEAQSKQTDHLGQSHAINADKRLAMLDATAQCLAVLEQTKAEPAARALAIGRRGLEAPQIKAETEVDRWIYSYFNLAEPCYKLIRELDRLDRLDALAAYAKLVRAPERAVFAYEIPPAVVELTGVAIEAVNDSPHVFYVPPSNVLRGARTWNLSSTLGLPHDVAYARLLLWLAVSHDPPQFGQDWLFSQQLHFLPAYTGEPSGRIRSVNRVHRGIWQVARRIVQAADSRPSKPIECFEDTAVPDLDEQKRAVKVAGTETEQSTVSEAALPKRFEAAYRSFESAEYTLQRKLTDQEAYDWLKENGPADYDLPASATWCRYVRVGRRHYGTQKNAPRAGRSGRSIIAARVALDRRESE